MCSTMPTASNRALGVMLSGAALAGWLAGSTLSPPVAVTQSAPLRPAAAPALARVELPHVTWPAVRRHVDPPVTSRNPFSFRAAPAADAPRGVAASAAEITVPSDAATPDTAPVVPVMRWRLSGIAASDSGDVVAVITGGGDVFLSRTGDVLPGGDAVVEVGPAHVVVRTADGPVTLRLP